MRNEYDARASQAHECAAQGPYCPMILPGDSKVPILCRRHCCIHPQGTDARRGWFALVCQASLQGRAGLGGASCLQARSRFLANPQICRRGLPPPSGHFAVRGQPDMFPKQKGAPRWGALDWRSAKIIRQVVTALWGVRKNAGGSGAAPRQPLQIAR